MQHELRRAWVEVDLGALKRNAAAMASRAQAPLLPMVKADAYGLGAVEVATALLELSPWGFGVACVAEGEELRAASIELPIVVFTPLLPWDFPALRSARLTPTLGRPEAIATWIATGGGAWHLAIDTGMHRAGIEWWRIGDVVELTRQHPPAAAFTHFHSADRNDGSLQLQQGRFREALSALPAMPPMLHAENSPGIERQSPSPWHLARPGVFLYGVGGEAGSAVAPEPVAHVRARIVELHDLREGETVSYGASYRGVGGPRRIATCSLGYADGYRRSLGNRGTALVNGRRVPVAGVVTMDMTMLDVTGAACEVGDVATFLGRDGDELLDVNAVARTADMSPYELLTGLRLRLPRIYREGAG